MHISYVTVFNRTFQLDIKFQFWKTRTNFFDSLTLKAFEEKGFTNKN